MVIKCSFHSTNQTFPISTITEVIIKRRLRTVFNKNNKNFQTHTFSFEIPYGPIHYNFCNSFFLGLHLFCVDFVFPETKIERL